MRHWSLAHFTVNTNSTLNSSVESNQNPLSPQYRLNNTSASSNKVSGIYQAFITGANETNCHLLAESYF